MKITTKQKVPPKYKLIDEKTKAEKRFSWWAYWWERVNELWRLEFRHTRLM